MERYKVVGWTIDGKRIQRTFDSTYYDVVEQAFELMPFVSHIYQKIGKNWIEVKRL